MSEEEYASVEIFKGEAKTITFTIKRNGTAIDMSTLIPAPTFAWRVTSEVGDSTYLIEKTDGDFDKSEESSGKVAITMTSAEVSSLDSGSYFSQLQTTFDTNDVDVSNPMYLIVEPSNF
jgi:hypothetical protein